MGRDYRFGRGFRAEPVYVYSNLTSPNRNSISDYWAVCWLSNEIVAAVDPLTIWVFNIVREKAPEDH